MRAGDKVEGGKARVDISCVQETKWKGARLG